MQENEGALLNKKDLVSIRDYVPADRSFILATWLRGMYYGNTWCSDIPKGIFMGNYHKVLESLLNKATTTIKIACLKDDPEVVLGYAVYRCAAGITVLDFVFVKSVWRKIGIAKDLLSQKIQYCSHITKLGKILKPKDCVYNPFLI